MSKGCAALGLQRHLITLKALDIVPDANGLITIPDDLPRTYRDVVWSLCKEFDQYDWRYAGDAA
jgi:hypothetical protein